MGESVKGSNVGSVSKASVAKVAVKSAEVAPVVNITVAGNNETAITDSRRSAVYETHV